MPLVLARLPDLSTTTIHNLDTWQSGLDEIGSLVRQIEWCDAADDDEDKKALKKINNNLDNIYELSKGIMTRRWSKAAPPATTAAACSEDGNPHSTSTATITTSDTLRNHPALPRRHNDPDFAVQNPLKRRTEEREEELPAGSTKRAALGSVSSQRKSRPTARRGNLPKPATKHCEDSDDDYPDDSKLDDPSESEDYAQTILGGIDPGILLKSEKQTVRDARQVVSKRYGGLKTLPLVWTTYNEMDIVYRLDDAECLLVRKAYEKLFGASGPPDDVIRAAVGERTDLKLSTCRQTPTFKK